MGLPMIWSIEAGLPVLLGNGVRVRYEVGVYDEAYQHIPQDAGAGVGHVPEGIMKVKMQVQKEVLRSKPRTGKRMVEMESRTEKCL